MRKILVPVDGSDSACRAAQFAAQLARDTGSEMTLMYVYDVPSAAAIGLKALSGEELENAKRYLAKGSFDKAEKAVGGVADRVDQVVAIGVPSHEIVTYAKNNGYDQIVMGSRGLTPLRELLLGSVSIRVLRHSSCPVTIVH